MKEPQLPLYDHQPRPFTGPTFETVMDLRKRFLNPALLTYYQKPVMIVEGSMQYVYDEKGRRYLDGFGGIVTISVGHCHPYILQMAREQMETLQHTTTIYYHPTIAEYARMLAEKMPGNLKVCYFVNSGSEANDLALLMARLYTGNFDVIALRNGYHGGSPSAMGLTALSTWKFNSPQGFGVHHALAPDLYRGPWQREDPEAGDKYGDDIKNLIDYATSGQVAAFIAETIQGVGGYVVCPDGYLPRAYNYIRQAGGVCIADEVQSGFGRTGTHYWGFETQGVIPDIVTLAKGIGNGTPLAAVVTTPEIAQSLTNRIHFNTYGGNPVSSAIGKAVLEVIDREGLQQRSLEVGNYFLEGLRGLMSRHSLIGDVRGKGLLIGVELVRDQKSKEPARQECARVFERAKDLGLLIGKGGFYGNVLRLAPPMCITRMDVDFALEVLDMAFREL